MRSLPILASCMLTCAACDQQPPGRAAVTAAPMQFNESAPSRSLDEARLRWVLNGKVLELSKASKVSSALPDDVALSLKCEPAKLLLVAHDIVLTTDLGSDPPLGADFVAIELESGGTVLTGRIGEEGSAYVTWATGRFHVGEGDIENFSRGPELIVRPLLAAHRAARFEGRSQKAMVYPGPPRRVRDAFVKTCAALNAQFY